MNKKSLPVQRLVDPLSERELEVLRLICASKSNQEIADELFLVLDTVKRHTNNLYGKLCAGLVICSTFRTPGLSSNGWLCRVNVFDHGRNGPGFS
jgi:hypothetical protein